MNETAERWDKSMAVVQPRARYAALWSMKRIGGKRIVLKVFGSLQEDDLTGRAAQLAYYFFFALFPGLIAASAVLGLAAKSTDQLSNNLLEYLATVIPPSAYQIVSDTFHQTTHASSGKKVILGALAALWTASAGTSAIQDALNTVNKVKETRPYWKAKLYSLILTVVMAGIFVGALGVLFYGDTLVAHEHQGFGYLAVFAVRLLTWPIAFCILSLGFAIVYWAAPDVKNEPWEWITPGAAIGIVLWLAASFGLKLYLHYFDSYSVTYGSLGAVIVLLTWFYLSGLTLLLGAEINSTLIDFCAEPILAERS